MPAGIAPRNCQAVRGRSVLLAFTMALTVPALVPNHAGMGIGLSRPGAIVSVLAYHRFGPDARDVMTVRTSNFRAQLDFLQQHGYGVVPLREVVSFLAHEAPAPPRRSVVITVDDGHASVFSEMRPIVLERRIPVTLFIYPSAISNASYAMTWQQIGELKQTGLFDVQSHTYWHPNFRIERRRLTRDAYVSFAMTQLTQPRNELRRRLGVEADMLAWPFGLVDEELTGWARDAGYVAAFTLEPRPVRADDRLMELPRFLVNDSATGRRFTAMLPDGS